MAFSFAVSSAATEGRLICPFTGYGCRFELGPAGTIQCGAARAEDPNPGVCRVYFCALSMGGGPDPTQGCPSLNPFDMNTMLPDPPQKLCDPAEFRAPGVGDESNFSEDLSLVRLERWDGLNVEGGRGWGRVMSWSWMRQRIIAICRARKKEAQANKDNMAKQTEENEQAHKAAKKALKEERRHCRQQLGQPPLPSTRTTRLSDDTWMLIQTLDVAPLRVRGSVGTLFGRGGLSSENSGVHQRESWWGRGEGQSSSGTERH